MSRDPVRADHREIRRIVSATSVVRDALIHYYFVLTGEKQSHANMMTFSLLDFYLCQFPRSFHLRFSTSLFTYFSVRPPPCAPLSASSPASLTIQATFPFLVPKTPSSQLAPASLASSTSHAAISSLPSPSLQPVSSFRHYTRR